MTKKILALVLALVMVFAMTACTSTEEPAESPAATDDAGTESTEPTASAGSGEVVNLLYYEIGNQDTNSREAVQEAINAYIEPLIGANVEFRIVSWADWDSRALTALQSGEEIDLFFTADWKQYTRSVMQGLFTPLNDPNGTYGNLLETYGQDIINSLNPLFITGTQIDGINYGVPVNKELSVPNGYIVNNTAAAEVGMDPATITGIADLRHRPPLERGPVQRELRRRSERQPAEHLPLPQGGRHLGQHRLLHLGEPGVHRVRQHHLQVRPGRLHPSGYRSGPVRRADPVQRR